MATFIGDDEFTARTAGHVHELALILQALKRAGVKVLLPTEVGKPMTFSAHLPRWGACSRTVELQADGSYPVS